MSALDPADIGDLLDQWLWFKLDETSGAVIVDSGNAFANGGAQLYGPACTVQGTTAAIFANAGAITPAGDNWCASRSGIDGLSAGQAQALRTAQKNFMNASTLCANAEQLLVVLRLSLNAAPSGDEVIFCAGSSNATEGGWGVRLASTGKVRVAHRIAAGGSTENFSQNTAIPAAHAAIKTVVFLLDGINKYSAANDGVNFQPVVHVFGDDGIESSTPMTAPVGQSADGGNHGLVLFGISGLATPNNRLGNSGSGVRLYDLFMQRTNFDLSTSVMRIVKDLLDGGPGVLSSEQAA